jgi:hypothetical protein
VIKIKEFAYEKTGTERALARAFRKPIGGAGSMVV